MHMAEIHQAQGSYRMAIYNLKKALSYNPGWGKAQKMLAAVYKKDGQFNSAIKELQEYSLSCDPAERDSIQKQIDRLIDEMRTNGRPSETAGVTAPEQDSGTELPPAADTSKARQTRSQGAPVKKITVKTGAGASQKNETAELEFTSGVEAYSNGLNSGNQSYFEEALEHFRKAIILKPDHAGAYYYAGLVRKKNGQTKMAEYNFKRAVSYPDLGLNAYFYLGKIYGEEGRYKEAISNLEKYISGTDFLQGKREAQSLVERYSAALNALKKDTVTIDIKSLGKEEMEREVAKIPPEALYAPVEVRIDSLLDMSIVDTLTDPGQAMLAQ
jgi:tetratricopeptide (TPR) repeat protein